MTAPAIAKIFRHGRSQAVRLPLAYRLPGKEARVRRAGRAVILEPIDPDLKAWFAELDAMGGGDILPSGRRQPRAQARRKLR